jgi:hypothetical protein
MRLALVVLLAALACGPVGSGTQGSSEALARFERVLAPDIFAAGERRLVPLAITNLTARAWTGGTVKVSYHWRGPKDVWEGERTSLPADVRSGESVDVVAVVIAPTIPGNYTLVWDLVDDVNAWFGVPGAPEIPVQVRAPEARAEWASVSLPEQVHADVVSLVEVKLRNTGTVTWPATGEGAVLLSYHWRYTHGGVSRWDGERTKLERPVAPNETLEAKMRIAPPPVPGQYFLEVDLLREGIAWFDSPKRIVVDVGEPSFTYAMELRSAPKRVVIGEPIDVRLSLTNTGKAPWPTFAGRRVKLSYHVFTSQGHVAQWDGARTELGRPVGAGETVDLQATVRAPYDAGTYTFRFDLVQEGVKWLADRNRTLDVRVEVVPVDFAAQFAAVRADNRMALETPYNTTVTVKNVGAVPWPRGGFAPVRLSYHWLDGAGKAVVWDGPRTDLPKDLAPNESVTLTFPVTAPKHAGAYTLVVDLVQEGVAWFAQKGSRPARLDVQVAKPSFEASWKEVDIPRKMKAGTIFKGKISVRNDGLLPWSRSGAHPVKLGHHWWEPGDKLFVWDGFRTDLDRDVQPGETVTLEVWFFVPATAGEYALEIDLVQEGITWFGWRGNPILRRSIEVVP